MARNQKPVPNVAPLGAPGDRFPCWKLLPKSSQMLFRGHVLRKTNSLGTKHTFWPNVKGMQDFLHNLNLG